ncbi:MAG: nitrile hydratase subunit beta [Rhodobacteraceae bacterium]|nr:nitrile hydratase subunit beta [Paracoccaceae bacterium]
MGGDPAGQIDMDEHDYALWEKRVDALLLLTSGKGYFTVDGLRRVLEDLGPEAFETQTYYERWVQAVNQNLLEAGAYSIQDIAEKMAQVEARGSTYGDCTGGGG